MKKGMDTTMGKYLVCVSDERHADYQVERDLLKTIGAELRLCSCAAEDDLIAQCGDADAILLDLAPMTARAIAGLKHCKVISRYGVGYENVDLQAATQAGIQVTNVPDYCMEDVSDHALALMLSCMRHIPMRDRKIRQGAWNIQGTSFRMKGRVLGVIGAGRIARALVRRPEILILDDAASALDYATDARLRRALRALEDTTVIIVSQRTASIRFADQILVLDDGKAVGLGTHETLLETCGVYREIYDSQYKKEAQP